VRGTHFLGTTEGGTCQDKERKKPSEEHSLPGDGRVRNFSELERKRQSEGTHFLEMAEGVSYQDTERKRPNEGHSLSGDGRGRDLSGHRVKETERGALTCWRWWREGLVRTWKESD
jgi:hypothetical protein